MLKLPASLPRPMEKKRREKKKGKKKGEKGEKLHGRCFQTRNEKFAIKKSF